MCERKGEREGTDWMRFGHVHLTHRMNLLFESGRLILTGERKQRHTLFVGQLINKGAAESTTVQGEGMIYAPMTGLLSSRPSMYHLTQRW